MPLLLIEQLEEYPECWSRSLEIQKDLEAHGRAAFEED
jgi:hypothetical protein